MRMRDVTGARCLQVLAILPEVSLGRYVSEEEGLLQRLMAACCLSLDVGAEAPTA